MSQFTSKTLATRRYVRIGTEWRIAASIEEARGIVEEAAAAGRLAVVVPPSRVPPRIYEQAEGIKREQWACDVCGNPYYPGRANQRTCGKKCGGLIRGGQIEDLVCEQCGKVFKSYKSLRPTGRVFCSKLCFGLTQRTPGSERKPSIVRETRLRLGLTQPQLAKKLKTSVKNIEKWESKGILPKYEEVRKRLEALIASR